MKSPLSWLSAVMTGFGQREVGTIWQGEEAAGEAKSLSEVGKQCRICFRNLTDETLILCWMSEGGDPYHFYALPPFCQNDNSNPMLRSRVIAVQKDHDHVETTVEGHAFLIASADDVDAAREKKSLKKEDGVTLVGAYRAEAREKLDPTKDADSDTKPQQVHLVEIVDPNRNMRSLTDLLVCCQPIKQALEGRKFAVRARMVQIDDTPLDTTKKTYVKSTLGKVKWPVYLEDNWHGGDKELEQLLEKDLDHMASCLPKHAVDMLRESTPIWINRTIKYGPKACPVQGKGMCFHPEKEWLQQNGMCLDKCECVEMYCAAEYKTTRCYWGTGGILVHEFSHAYHHKGCTDGYKNKEILECYELAMKDKLYESVFVHGPQGPKAKAYACNNAMEYFAELSTAFLGGNKTKAKERDAPEDEEYNKWYPFNRQQIRKHDPRAYELLKSIWKVEDSE